MLAGTGLKKIIFNHWSNANYNLAIKHIRNSEARFTATKKYVDSFESLAQITNDGSQPNYSILKSSGVGNLKDKDNRIYQIARLGYLDAFIYTVYIYLNGKVIQTHTSTDSPYYKEDTSVKINLTNALVNLESIIVNEKEYAEEMSLKDIYIDIMRAYSSQNDERILASMNTIINVGNGVDMSVASYLETIKVPPFRLPEMTLNDFINQICGTAQLYACQDDEGQMKFYNGRPLITNNESQSIMRIDYGMQRTRINYDVIISNRFSEIVIK
jgi:hypothetical protein